MIPVWGMPLITAPSKVVVVSLVERADKDILQIGEALGIRFKR